MYTILPFYAIDAITAYNLRGLDVEETIYAAIFNHYTDGDVFK